MMSLKRALSAGSLGCGNDFGEPRIATQIIPARIEAEIAVSRAVRNCCDRLKLFERAVTLTGPRVHQCQVGYAVCPVDRVLSDRLELNRAACLADRLFFTTEAGINGRNF